MRFGVQLLAWRSVHLQVHRMFSHRSKHVSFLGRDAEQLAATSFACRTTDDERTAR